MNKLLSLATLLFISTGLMAADSSGPDDHQQAKRPNVIFIFTDDHGYADLGVQGQEVDIKTPHIDSLAMNGVRMRAGYTTAPQCIPSRAGALTGMYQNRFALDDNKLGPLPLDVKTIPQRLQEAGYVTGMVGKWHLEPNHNQTHWLKATMPAELAKNPGKNVNIPQDVKHPYQPGQRGFTEFFDGRSRTYQANYDLDGNSLAVGGEQVTNTDYRLDVQTGAAEAFIERNHDNPFFLYLAYYGPHVPLEATEKYLARFPGDMPERRRVALAMISAIDEGVGKITRLLEEKGILENTLIFFVSDNGAPTKMHYEDLPLSYVGGWDGSMNTPWVGEKGMLSEGGIRVPFVVSWKGVLPEGKVYDAPVSTLDIGATALALAGAESDVVLDGVNIVPYLTGEKDGVPHETLYWRFWSQLAVREGKYKYLKLIGNEEYLFDLEADEHETRNLLADKPALAARLAKKLDAWNSALPANRSIGARIKGEEDWFNFYFKFGPDQ